jgi:DNA-binding PadR family transcriptional regulator
MIDRNWVPIQTVLGDGSAISPPFESELPRFDLSFLDLVVLHSIDSEPATGYVLKKRLSEQFRLRSSFGTLYPRLKTFEKEGIIKLAVGSTETQPRGLGIQYEITLKGKKVLSENLQTFNGFLQKIRDGPQKAFH